MLDVILSPDLLLAERVNEARQRRLSAVGRFKIGDYVKAGTNGRPGYLDSYNENGFASIRWDDGRLLCGVAADELHAG